MTRARGLGLTTVGRLLGKTASESVQEFETLFGAASGTSKLSLYIGDRETGAFGDLSCNPVAKAAVAAVPTTVYAASAQNAAIGPSGFFTLYSALRVDSSSVPLTLLVVSTHTRATQVYWARSQHLPVHRLPSQLEPVSVTHSSKYLPQMSLTCLAV